MNSDIKATGDASELKVRGLMYAAASRWTAEQFGDDKLEKFLETLPDEYSNILRNFDKKQWYPARGAFVVYDHLIDFLANEMSEPEVIDGITNFMFSNAITGFMKGLLSFLTPARLTRRATSFWLRVHSQGRIEYVEDNNNQFRVILHDWSVHRTSCLIFAGWLKQLVIHTGASEVRVEEINCSLHSSEPCQWLVKFTP